MTEFLKMDIFFVITTLAVIAVGAVLVIVLIRFRRVLGNIERISKNAAEESDALREDIKDLRAKVRAGMGLGYLAGALSSFFGKKRNSKGKK